jgi:hypothetical protein
MENAKELNKKKRTLLRSPFANNEKYFSFAYFSLKDKPDV